MKISKLIWISIGFFSLAIGLIGVILPLLPSFPFFMLTLYCFTKSSDKLRCWFMGTTIYKQHLEYYISHKAMTKKMKMKIMCIVTILMSFGFFMMGNVPIAQVILLGVWIFHLFYFTYKIKTREITDEK